MSETPVARVLDTAGIQYRVFRHPNPVRSLEQAASERGQRPEQVVRSILFRLSADEFVMVLVAGGQQISWSALRSYLGQNRMTMASKEEVLEVTGYPVGGVSPLGLPAPLRILVDRGVLQEEEISLGSGIRNITVILKSEDLMKALGEVEVGEFAGGEGERGFNPRI